MFSYSRLKICFHTKADAPDNSLHNQESHSFMLLILGSKLLGKFPIVLLCTKQDGVHNLAKQSSL